MKNYFLKRAKWVLLLPLILFCGCSSQQLEDDYVNYPKAYTKASDSQLLLSLARLSRDEPVNFLQLSTISSQYTYTTQAGGGTGSGFPVRHGILSLAGNFMATRTASPTFGFVPISGSNFVNAVWSPLNPKIYLTLYDQDWPADWLIRTMAMSVLHLKSITPEAVTNWSTNYFTVWSTNYISIYSTNYLTLINPDQAGVPAAPIVATTPSQLSVQAAVQAYDFPRSDKGFARGTNEFYFSQNTNLSEFTESMQFITTNTYQQPASPYVATTNLSYTLSTNFAENITNTGFSLYLTNLAVGPSNTLTISNLTIVMQGTNTNTAIFSNLVFTISSNMISQTGTNTATLTTSNLTMVMQSTNAITTVVSNIALTISSNLPAPVTMTSMQPLTNVETIISSREIMIVSSNVNYYYQSNFEYCVNDPHDPTYPDFLKFCNDLRNAQMTHALTVTEVNSSSTIFNSTNATLADAVAASQGGISVSANSAGVVTASLSQQSQKLVENPYTTIWDALVEANSNTLSATYDTADTSYLENQTKQFADSYTNQVYVINLRTFEGCLYTVAKQQIDFQQKFDEQERKWATYQQKLACLQALEGKSGLSTNEIEKLTELVDLADRGITDAPAEIQKYKSWATTNATCCIKSDEFTNLTDYLKTNVLTPEDTQALNDSSMTDIITRSELETNELIALAALMKHTNVLSETDILGQINAMGTNIVAKSNMDANAFITLTNLITTKLKDDIYLDYYNNLGREKMEYDRDDYGIYAKVYYKNSTNYFTVRPLMTLDDNNLPQNSARGSSPAAQPLPVSTSVTLDYDGKTYAVSDMGETVQNRTIFTILSYLFGYTAIPTANLPVQQLIQVQ